MDRQEEGLMRKSVMTERTRRTALPRGARFVVSAFCVGLLLIGGVAPTALAGVVTDCDTAPSPTDCVQPDGRIKRSGGPVYGNDIYNTDADGQAVHLKIYAGDRRRVYISIQNDGVVSGTFRVCQCSGTQGSQPGFTFTYFVNRSDEDITAGVEAGTFTTPSLAPGEKFVIRARVEVSEAATPGSPIGRFFRITSTAAGQLEDSVAIWAQRKPPANEAPTAMLEASVMDSVSHLCTSFTTANVSSTSHAYCFRGTNSTDPDNNITTWSIDFGDSTSTGDQSFTGNPPTSVTHTYGGTSTYTVVLTVTDAGGLTSTDTLTIEIVS
jgi:hypothetical protein